jgi:hypothetical protein
MVSQAKRAPEPENERNGARNQKQIVEPRMQKDGIDVWFEDPPVQTITGGADEEQVIAEISKLHRRHRISSPTPRTTSSLSKKVTTILQ